MECLEVSGYPNYLVYADGRIYSKFSRKFLKPVKHKNGYEFVDLFNDDGDKIISVHRIVAKAFIANPKGLNCVNHKNEVKSDNRAENLEWCTYKYNNNYGNHNSNLRKALARTPISQIKDGKIIANYNGVSEASRVTGIKQSGISNVLTGRAKTAGGYKWIRIK